VDRDQEFSQYVGARWASLVRSAALLGCSPHEAEDLVQTTLTRCYVSWSKVRSADNRDAYVYRALVNSLRDAGRRQWRGERPTEDLPEEADESRPIDDVEVADAIERALGGLSETHRTVVVLRFFAHLGERETAQALGIPPGTVKSRLARALAELSTNQHLADLNDGTDG
jgi:RNA polymerase sigma-70 factor (sigma-E family)